MIVSCHRFRCFYQSYYMPRHITIVFQLVSCLD
nr:MAG TPA: hypothetical protein [Caudoviricetes sp.]